MPARLLTAPGREEIRAGIERCEPDAVIGDRLGRHGVTSNREISLNGVWGAYTATVAQVRADRGRARPQRSKLRVDPVLAAHVTARLEVKDSLMTISVELARGVPAVTAWISHECIYQAVSGHGRGGLRKGLHKRLYAIECG